MRMNEVATSKVPIPNRESWLSSFFSWMGSRKVAPYVFITPFYIIFMIFGIGPIGFAIFMSLTSWAGLEAPKFIGLANYFQMFKDATFRLSVVNSIWYIAAMLFISIPLAFLLAAFLNNHWLKNRTVFRGIYFLPAITSSVVIGIVFRLFYDLNYGVLNYFLGLVGLPPIDWIGTAAWFKPAVIILLLWRWVGYTSVFFLAGMQAISQEILEAALVDGANTMQRYTRVIIPILRPVILFVTVTVTINSFQIFEEPYVLSGRGFYQSGGPGDAGLSLALYLYRMGFQFGQLGFASAVGMVIFAAVFVLSVLELRRGGLFVSE
jgi:ABC-type sugar transport system permease subunit